MELVHLAMATDTMSVAAVQRLRRVCTDAEVVRAALALGEARRRGIPKFGRARAAALWADPGGVEMATSAVVAEHKRDAMLVYWPGEPVMDVCCGIGGDTMALVESGEVIGVDREPVRAWMAARNAGCRVDVGDASGVGVDCRVVHIDPARRNEASGSRVWRLGGLQPAIEVVRDVVMRARGAAVKLGPGVDLEEVARWFPGSHVEVISERGTLVQCVVWINAPGVHRQRSATLLGGLPDEPAAVRKAKSWRMTGDPAGEDSVPVAADNLPGRYVHEPDDAVERAGLLGTLCLRTGAAMVHARVGLLTSDVAVRSPWLTNFEVLAEMPWNQRRVKGALDGLGAGIVEVKTRAGVVGTDEMQMALRGAGDKSFVVFVLRLGRAIRCIIARRAPEAA